jgi:lipoyl(octanoyl) transferase
MILPAFGWAWLGRVSYRRTWTLQEELRRRILDGCGGDTLLLLEHEPVITLGRHADPTNVLLPEGELCARGVELVETSRGGDVTYHGPGQLVGYPVFRLRRGLVHHLETLAEALCALCAEEGVVAEWRRDPVGVWVGAAKLVAFGVHVHRNVALHGFAFNVSTPLEAFDAIVPCGLRHTGVTSLARLTGKAGLTPGALAPRVAAALAAAAARTAVQQDAADLWRLISPVRPIQ